MNADRPKRAISEVTRRNISDAFILAKVFWWGRFEEQQFLARLYNLAEMPSTDRRCANASEDIWQHRQRNIDWPNDWVFYDSRFNLIGAPDEEFLRFACEILHPVVQEDANEVDRMRRILNEHLVKDGWEIREQMQISGRPVFAAFRSFGSEVHTAEAAKVVSEAIDTEYVSRQITRMQSSLASDPDVAIGTAKEFVETICKTILRERNIPYDSAEKMPRLVKQVAAALELIPPGVSGEVKATETVKRLLSNLGSVSDGLAELRNLHGTGHGKDADAGGLALRHARLAVGSATALAVFLLEAHMETKT
jgi:AbiJ-like protein/abortive infection Abi-like protein